ncbi:MFS general substrate transporter [Hymenopellis radicata]|nr:MFS general substrate transporter [Hymenopellis radicata]
MPTSHQQSPQGAKKSLAAQVDFVGSGEKQVSTNESAYRRKAWIHFLPLCFSLFMVGWNDATLGPLLPRIQREYDIGFTVVSLILIFNCLGCVIGAILNFYFTQKFGFGKTIVIAATTQLVSFVLQSPGPPFPVFILGSVLGGFGLALQDAQANGYVAGLARHASLKMGVIQAVYGVGALVAPFISTTFSHVHRWSFMYLVSLGLSFLNVGSLILVFRFRQQNDCFAEEGQIVEVERETHENHYKQVLKLRTVYIIAAFLLLYVGVEVTLGSWIVTYIIRVRDGGKLSGYVAAGFWGGLTIGRVALIPVSAKIGETRAVFMYITLALGLDLVVWLVPSLIADSVCVAFIGLCLGPIYPIGINVAGRVLPPWLLTEAIGLMVGVGSAGSAVFPFVLGAIASARGIASIHPFLIAMLGVLFVLWFIVASLRPYVRVMEARVTSNVSH